MLRIRSLPRASFTVLLAVGSAQAADAITFVRMIREYGARAEANPIIAHLVRAGDLVPLLLVKLALVVVVLSVFVIAVQRHRVAGSLVATLAVIAGLLGAFTNLAVIR